MARNLNHVDNWLIRCVKCKKDLEMRTLREAIEIAREIDQDLQPSFGVDIWSDDILICTIDGQKIDWAELED